MATIGRTLFRLTGAVLLGASATSIDNPRLLESPSFGGRVDSGHGGPDSINTSASETPTVRSVERSPAAPVESPFCGVHVRPGVIVRYLLDVNCGRAEGLKFAKDSAFLADSIQRRP